VYTATYTGSADGSIETQAAYRQGGGEANGNKSVVDQNRSLGGVPGFVLVHTPAGHTNYGLIYRNSKGERKKLTLGTPSS
jgi:hypothetical protein